MSGKIKFVVSGRKLLFEQTLWLALEGPKPEEGYGCNGCSFSPDRWWLHKVWVPVVLACIVHDNHYDTHKPLGTGWRARQKADAILYRNLKKIIWYHGGTIGQAERIAWLYWGRCRLWGGKAWRGDAPGFFRRLWNVWRPDS